jgi:hypothetical protein
VLVKGAARHFWGIFLKAVTDQVLHLIVVYISCIYPGFSGKVTLHAINVFH